MTDKDFTKILFDLSSDMGDIKGALGEIKGGVKESLRLHHECPARLGFDVLKDTTASLRLVKKNRDSDMPLTLLSTSQLNGFLKTVAPYVWKGLLIFGLAFGASVFARVSTSDMDQAPTIKAIGMLTEIASKTEKGVAEVERRQENDLDAGAR